MVTFEIQKYLFSANQIDETKFDFFDNLEILNGEQLCEYYLKDS